MPLLDKDDRAKEVLAPGTERWALVDGDNGAESLSVGDLHLAPGASMRTHTHPTEEAMVILEGELEAVLGDEKIPVTIGHTILAPPGVKHGFLNRSSQPARLMAIFPTATIERTFVD